MSENDHPPHPELDDLHGGRWVVRVPFTVDLGGCTLTVPAGYVYDLASVPRPLWSAIAPFELGPTAPLVHDALYRCGGVPPVGWVKPPRRFTRAEADRLLLELARQCGVGFVRRRLAYLAVRLAGWSAWRRRPPQELAAIERGDHAARLRGGGA